jgi:transcriptional regulator with XRE-family HTH domain
MLVGARIRRLREERGLSQRALTDGLERVSNAYVSRLESGQRVPSDRALRLIAGRLGTTALYLQTGRRTAKCPHCGRADG